MQQQRVFLVKKGKQTIIKHILIFFKNDLGENLKGISFNTMNTLIGDYLMKFNKFKFHILCSIKKDNFSSSQMPQILIHDVKVIN